MLTATIDVFETPAAARFNVGDVVTLKEGGQSIVIVSDDGIGMDRDELALAVERHCTSKLPDDDLLKIDHLGFRGEALPSIGAVSRLTITSRKRGGSDAWTIAVEGGIKGAVQSQLLLRARVRVI